MKIPCFALSLALAMAPACASARSTHNFSVRDSIEMTRFSDPSALDPGATVRFSPDGKYFTVVTSRGILASNSIESTLWLYRTDAVRRYANRKESTKPPARTLLAQVTAVPEVIATEPYEAVLTEVRWSTDSRTIYFLAQDVHGNRRLSSVNLDHRQIKALSRAGYDVYQYSISPSAIVFSTTHPLRTPEFPIPTKHGLSYLVNGIPLDDLILHDPKFSEKLREVWVLRSDGRLSEIATLREKAHFSADTHDDPLSISPNGKYAVLLTPAHDIPLSWAKFKAAAGQKHQAIDPADPRRISPADLNSDRLMEFALVSLRDGVVHTVNAPVARQLGYFHPVKAIWSPNSKAVLLTNTFLPFAGNSSTDTQREYPCAAAVVRLESLTPHCVLSSEPNAAAGDTSLAVLNGIFSQHGRTLSLSVSQGGAAEVRHYGSAGSIPTETTLPRGGNQSHLPHVFIHQTLNDPPVLAVSTGTAGDFKPLWDPNPQLRTINLGKTIAIRWKDQHGRDWTGGLVFPVGYKAAKRYPLLIQIYQFRDHEFMTDGMSTTAMAARPLASVGIAFLEITKHAHTFNQSEMDENLDGILSAIDTLNAQGVIDPKKVGLIGFSASCPYVEYALIKEPSRFAAATIADGIDNSYMQEMLWGSSNVALQEQFKRINGSLPFGDGLKEWIKLAPDFQLSKVTTPLRIEAIRPLSLLSEWEIYSSLEQQHKAVQLIYIPDGQHILQKPRDRMISQQGDVEWLQCRLQIASRYRLQIASNCRPWSARRFLYQSW